MEYYLCRYTGWLLLLSIIQLNEKVGMSNGQQAIENLKLRGVQAHLIGIAGSVPDHRHKASIVVKWLTQSFWCPSAYKIYVHTIL